MKLSKSQIIINFVNDKIQKGDFNKNTKLPTEYELCQNFDLSRTTVRNALKQLQEDNIIYSVKGSGTYINESPDKIKINCPSNLIPLIICSKRNSTLYFEIIHGAQNYLKSHGYYLTVHCPEDNPMSEIEIIDDLISKGHDTFIIFPHKSNQNIDYYYDLINKNYKLIFIDFLPEGINASLVSSDNVHGGYLLAEHLLKNGYKNLALLGGFNSSISTINDRVFGVSLCLKKHGIEFKPDCDFRFNFNTPEEFKALIEEKVKHLIKLSPPPEAIICINDITALLVYDILLKFGLKVPEDIGLTGFDNLGLTFTNSVPITTIAQDFLSIGHNAAKLCFEKKNCVKNGFSQIYLPVSLKPRLSTDVKKS